MRRALLAALDPVVAARATSVGNEVRAEDGVAGAVELIEHELRR